MSDLMQGPSDIVRPSHARLGASDRLVKEDVGEALPSALPQRMKLRGGWRWTSFAGAAPRRPKVDATLVDGLHRARVLAADWSNDDHPDFRRRRRKPAFLSPEVKRIILEGRTPAGVGLTELLASDPPLRWSEQIKWIEILGKPNSPSSHQINYGGFISQYWNLSGLGLFNLRKQAPMTKLNKPHRSFATAKKHELLAVIIECAQQLSREELRTLGDRFHQIARDKVIAVQAWRQSAPEILGNQVWL